MTNLLERNLIKRSKRNGTTLCETDSRELMGVAEIMAKWMISLRALERRTGNVEGMAIDEHKELRIGAMK